MIFANVPATDKNKKPIEGSFYCVDWNQFSNNFEFGTNTPSHGVFFDHPTFGKGEIAIVASKKSINLMLLSNKRHKKSLKLLAPEEYTSFVDDTPYAITKPHKYYYHRKPKLTKNRYLLNLFTGEFTLISYEDFCVEGFNFFRKGDIIYRKKGEWKKLTSGKKVKIDLNEIEVHDLVSLATENFYDWMNKENKYSKCIKCKNNCKQSLHINGLQCKKFIPLVARKKTERKPKENKIDIVDTGSLLAEEVKRRFAKR